ncbi:MAG: FliG C-terminal domain-containing protein [Bacteriovoracia bacterium]
MGVLTRFKRNPEGFRALVELLESAPADKRQKMIAAGMAEDPPFMHKAMDLMMNFEDITMLSDPELAEVVAVAPPRITSLAISKSDSELQMRFFKCAPPRLMAEIRDGLTPDAALKAIGGAQLKMVEVARKLEREGRLRVKRIP